MPRGGRRAGRSGTAYSNRSDLTRSAPLPTNAPTGQEYGKATQQLEAQQAVPMASGPLNTGGAPVARPSAPPPVRPGELTAFDAPSERPDEPLTAGAPFGPGPGPADMDTTGDFLRALWAVDPNPDIRELIEELEGFV